MDSLPNEVLENLLIKSTVVLFVHSKRAAALDDVTSSTLAAIMSVNHTWWLALTGRWYQPTGRRANRRRLRGKFADLRPYQLKPRRTSMIEPGDPFEHHQVRGITQMNGLIFVVGSSSTDIHAFDVTPPHCHVTDLIVPNLSRPRDIVACSDTERLYVADWNVTDGRGRVWRIDEASTPMATTSTKASRPIITGSVPQSLALTSRRLLVTPYDGTRPLSMHDEDGQLLRRIKLPGWMRPLHAVETGRRSVIVCNRASTNDDVLLLQQQNVLVAELDLDGNVMMMFGDNCTHSPLQQPLVWPCYAVLDKDNGCLLVADQYRRQVVVLDDQLNICRILVSELDDQPFRLSYERSKCLVVSFLGLKPPGVLKLK